MTEPIRAVTDGDIQTAFGEGQQDILSEEAKDFLEKGNFQEFINQKGYFELIWKRRNQSQITLESLGEFCGHDSSIPANVQPVCSVHLARKIQEELESNFSGLPSPVYQYKGLEDLLKEFSGPNRQTWLRNNYIEFYQKIDAWKKELAHLAKTMDLGKVCPAILGIKEKLLKSDEVEEFSFAPRFYYRIRTREEDGQLAGDIVARKGGSKLKIGSFILIRVDSETQLFKIPFFLGLELGYHILPVCPECTEELRNTFFNYKKVQDRRTGRESLRWDLLPAQTYEDAVKRREYLEKRSEYNSDKPEEIDERNIHDQSCFGLSVDVFTPELDKELDLCETERDIYGVISRFLQKFNQEEINNLKVFLGENLGDLAEGKTMGQDGDRGKHAGLGPFGGKPEPKEEPIPDSGLRKLLPKCLYDKAMADSFYKRLIWGLVREMQNESGFEIAKIYCRVTRIPKANNTHFYHLWLVRMKNPTDTGQTLPVKERREMNANQMRFWIPFIELFQMKVSKFEGEEDCRLPYLNTLKNIINFFQRFSVTPPDGMAECEDRLRKLKTQLR
ncbi:MAG: hypothetical protein Q7S73_01600 [bacterium]|nr:hypothetical protein [bacterium]